MEIDFYFDLVSPYSYLASGLIGAVADRYDARVNWRPVFLGGILRATDNPTPALVPAKVRYMVRDLERCARHYKMAFAMPEVFPINTLLPQRLLCMLPPGDVAGVARMLFGRYWAEGADIGDPAVLGRFLSDDMIRQAQTETARERLKGNSDDAVRRGAFGVPSFFVGDELFFGHDRLPLLDARLKELKRNG